ncbi:MAG: hypothetical protein RDU30_00940 [Desulfovibrionaceae bacterium]|nr:hypothetical protein [Desulfovibrionaceae bacterium]
MTYFSKENGQWVPTGHEEYRTKLAAVKDATVSGAAYSPDVNFHRTGKTEVKERFEAQEPVSLTGNEIADMSSEPLDIKALRQKAVDFVDSPNFRQEVVNQHDNSTIYITRNGVKGALSHGSGPEKIQAVAAVPDMLERAVPVFSGPHQDGSPGKRIIYAAKMRTPKKTFVVGLVVHEDVNGNRFYDHEMTEMGSLEEASSQRGAASREAKLGVPQPPQDSVMNIVRDALGVNADLRFSKTESPETEPTGSTAASIKKALAPLLKRVKGIADRVQVVQSYEDLPVGLYAAAKHANMIGGFDAVYWQGDIYVVADAMTAKEAQARYLKFILGHEGGHHVARMMFPDPAHRHEFFAAVAKLVPDQVADYLDRHDLGNTLENRIMAAEEVTMDLVGGSMSSLKGAMKFRMKQFMARLRKFLAQIMPGRFTGATDQMIIDFVAEARAAIRRKGDAVYGVTGEEVYMRKSEMEAWAQQLDAFVDGKMPRGEVLTVGTTPKVLRLLGAKKLKLVMPQRNAAKILKDKHKLPVETLKDIPRAMADPVMVFDSATMADSFVVLTDLMVEGKPVLSAIHLNIPEKHFSVNEVASVYGKDEIRKWVSAQLANGRLRYQNKKKTSELRKSGVLQLHKEFAFRGKNKILTEADLVNLFDEEIDSDQSSRDKDDNRFHRRTPEPGTVASHGLPPETWFEMIQRIVQDKMNRLVKTVKILEARTGQPLPDHVNAALRETLYSGRTTAAIEDFSCVPCRPLRELRNQRAHEPNACADSATPSTTVAPGLIFHAVPIGECAKAATGSLYAAIGGPSIAPGHPIPGDGVNSLDAAACHARAADASKPRGAAPGAHARLEPGEVGILDALLLALVRLCLRQGLGRCLAQAHLGQRGRGRAGFRAQALPGEVPPGFVGRALVALFHVGRGHAHHLVVFRVHPFQGGLVKGFRHGGGVRQFLPLLFAKQVFHLVVFFKIRRGRLDVPLLILLLERQHIPV